MDATTVRQRDMAIQLRVINALHDDRGLDANRIGVTVHRGVATLYGSVGSCKQKQMAESVVLTVPGVRGLVHKLQILYGTELDLIDEQVALHTLEALNSTLAYGLKAISITVEDSVVVLIGVVGTFEAREQVEIDVRRVLGVTQVINELQLGTAPPAVSRTAMPTR